MVGERGGMSSGGEKGSESDGERGGETGDDEQGVNIIMISRALVVTEQPRCHKHPTSNTQEQYSLKARRACYL